MGKRKKQNVKIKGYQTEESAAIKKFVILTLIVIVFVVAMYFVTKVVTKDDSKDKESLIKYSYVTAGTMFNRSEKEYYVFAYDSTNKNKADYESVVTNYGYTGNIIPLYVADISDYLNKDYVDKENSNPDAKSLDDLKLGELTLLKVKDGKIINYLEDINKIKTELGIN